MGAPTALANVHGEYLLTFDLSGVTALPAGTTLNCKARVIPNGPGGGASHVEPASGRSGMGQAKSKCSVEVPYSWMADVQKGASLSYEIEAVSGSGTRVWAAAQQGIGVGFAPVGAILQVNFAWHF
jgi:hypothetical protein